MTSSRPSGFCPGQSLAAVIADTKPTGRLRSASVNSRPALNKIPSIRKYSGLTVRMSAIGRCVRGTFIPAAPTTSLLPSPAPPASPSSGTCFRADPGPLSPAAPLQIPDPSSGPTNLSIENGAEKLKGGERYPRIKRLPASRLRRSAASPGGRAGKECHAHGVVQQRIGYLGFRVRCRNVQLAGPDTNFA